MKKIISVVTAIFVLSVLLCPMMAFAAQEPTFEVASVSAAPDMGAEVTIEIKNNPGIASAKLKVEFDSALELKEIRYGEDLGGITQAPQSLESPVTLNWFDGEKNLTEDVIYATLDFAVKSDAQPGDYNVTVTYDQEDVYKLTAAGANSTEENVKFNVVNGVVTVTDGTDPALTGDVTTIGSLDENGDYTGGEEDPFAEDEDIAANPSGGVDPVVIVILALVIVAIIGGVVIALI